MTKTMNRLLLAAAALSAATVATAFVGAVNPKAEGGTADTPPKTEVRVVEELSWEGEKPPCGYGEVRKNLHCDGSSLVVGGVTYTENSIGTHLPSAYGNQDIVYDISAYSNEFTYVDLDVSMCDGGMNNVIFSVLADNTVVDTVHYNRRDTHKPIKMIGNIAGASKLTLRICTAVETPYDYSNGACAFLDVKLVKGTENYTRATYIYDRITNPAGGGWSYSYGDGVLYNADVSGNRMAYNLYEDALSYEHGMGVHLKNVSYETYSASDESKANINNYVLLKWDISAYDFSYFSTLCYAAAGYGYHVDAWIDGAEVYTSGKIDSIGTCTATGLDARKAPTEIGVKIPSGAQTLELKIVADTWFNDGMINLACPVFFERGNKLSSVYGVQTASSIFPLQAPRTYMRDGRRTEYYDAATGTNVTADDGLFFIAGTSYEFDVSDAPGNTIEGILGKADFGHLDDGTAPLELRYTVEDKDGKVIEGATESITKETSGKAVSIYIGNNAKKLTLSLYSDDPSYSDATFAGATFTTKYRAVFNDGTADNTVTLAAGDPLTAPTDPVRAGYTFGGWVKDGESAAFDFTDKTITEDMNFTAIWTANKYDVNYYVKMGDQEPVAADTDYPQGEYSPDKITELPQAKEIEGYDFVGWFVGETKVESLAADAYADNVTVVAKYDKKTFTVTFVSGGATVDTATVEWGDTVQSVKADAAAGYTFTGWNTDENTAFDFNTQIKSDVTLTAVFAPEEYRVIFRRQLGSNYAQTADYPETVHVFGTDTALPQAETVDGYIFVGWYVDDTAVTKLDGDKYFANITVTAKYRKEPVKVVFVSEGVEYPVEYDEGQTASPKPLEREGYEFVGWYLDEACTKEYDFDKPLGADVKLYAKWKKAESPDGGNSVDGLAIGLGVGGGVLALGGGAVAAGLVIRAKKKKKANGGDAEKEEKDK